LEPLIEKPPRNVLLVEDDPNDEELEVRALRRAWPSASVTVARDGVEAVERLTSEPPPVFDLILLDIKLPMRSGIEVLQQIRADARFHLVPIVMLTSSAELSDVRRCYQLGANSYIQKALDFQLFLRNVGMCAEYWLSVNVSPR